LIAVAGDAGFAAVERPMAVKPGRGKRRKPPNSKTFQESKEMNTDNASKEDPGVEEVLEEIVDLEDYAKRGERPPLSKGYRIRVNGEAFVLHDPTPTGREILTLAGLLPAEDYTLREKLAGERPRRIELDRKVDLRRPGVEKFEALPRDQTDARRLL
jgi:hypothetical protein